MVAEKIDFIESMKVLEFKPGDIVVLKTDVKLSSEAAERLRHAVAEIISPEPRRVKVMILEEGMDIGVLRGEQ